MASSLLKTLPKPMYSKDLCLNHLMAALAKFTNIELIRKLSHIGKILHSASTIETGQSELINTYTSEAMKADLLNDANKGVSAILFHRCALKLIDELLRINPLKTPVSELYERTNISDDYLWQKSLIFPKHVLGKACVSIEALFLFANTLIHLIESEPPCIKMEKYSEKNKIFYSRLDINQRASVGRARMYNYQDLSSRLKVINIDIDEYLKAISALCAHVESQPFIELELPKSINKMTPNAQRILSTYIPLISTEIQSNAWSLATTKSNLQKLYITDALCRQRPLIKLNNRYFCLQPKFLWAALADLPYYLLLDSCKKVRQNVKLLGKSWGDAFEESFRDLGNRAFGSDKCIDYACNNEYPKMKIKKEHRIGDLFLSYETNTRVIFEFKGVAPSDKIKLGDRVRARSNFIQLVGKNKGIPQLIRDSTIYRLETSFKGDVYIVLVCRGPVPLTTDFDTDLKNHLDKYDGYQDYLNTPQNKPLIYLDAFSTELLFNACRQGLPITDLLKSLVGLSPSLVLEAIKQKVEENDLRVALSPLYIEEIKDFERGCNSMFYDETLCSKRNNLVQKQ